MRIQLTLSLGAKSGRADAAPAGAPLAGTSIPPMMTVGIAKAEFADEAADISATTPQTWMANLNIVPFAKTAYPPIATA
jgi:hypothetical protein